MAFFKLMCKASRITSIKRDLLVEKQNAIQISKGYAPKYSARQKYRHFWIDVREKFKKGFGRLFSCCENTCLHRTCYNLHHDGTCENFTLKSVAGFIGGFFLTYIFFMFFVFQLNFKLSTATIMCSFFGSILTIGLAFSYKVRCIVFLLLPQFFSKRGRQALLAYAFILAITGPAKNTLNNMGILSESLACGQEQLKQAVRQIIEVIKKPFYAIKDAIKQVVKTVKVIVKKIKEILLTIKRIIMAILRVIKAAFQFLGKIINICNKELGTPFQRCTRVFENAIADCNAKLGPLFSWLCSIAYLVQSVCYLVKIFDFVCMIVDFISNSVVGVVIRKLKTFVRHIRTMFYVRVRFSHSFHFETNQSKSMSEITEGIVTEIRHRTEGLLTVFDFMSCATSLFFLFIVVRVMHYRYKFLTNERFDNKYITKYFRFIDLRRAKLGKETVLPLNHREKTIYVAPKSLRLVISEKRNLSKASAVLGTATLKLCTHMMADYALYWVLTKIRYYGRFQSTVQSPNIPTLHIQGKGLLADLLRSIVNAFQPIGIQLEIDTVPCLPDPIPPDYDRYVQIASLLVLCWFLTVFEPYGLRLRHFVMNYYHPTRAKQRAVWLYNHILRSRSSFLKFARRQLRRKVTGNKSITKITLKEWLRANCRWLRLCLGSDRQDACLLCGEVFRESDEVKPIRCQTPGCPGIYCEQCFQDLQNLCTICLDPIQYGDLSDISEEKDSSGDEVPPVKKRKKWKCRLSKCCRREKDKYSDSETDESTGFLTSETTKYSETTPFTTDSDYSSGSSTDYDFTYQKHKDITKTSPRPPQRSSRDVEKQHIPDYTTMDALRDTSEEEYESVSPVTYKDEAVSASFESSSSSVLTQLETVEPKGLRMQAPPKQIQFIGSHPPADDQQLRKKVPAGSLSSNLLTPLQKKKPKLSWKKRIFRKRHWPTRKVPQETISEDKTPLLSSENVLEPAFVEQVDKAVSASFTSSSSSILTQLETVEPKGGKIQAPRKHIEFLGSPESGKMTPILLPEEASAETSSVEFPAPDSKRFGKEIRESSISSSPLTPLQEEKPEPSRKKQIFRKRSRPKKVPQETMSKGKRIFASLDEAFEPAFADQVDEAVSVSLTSSSSSILTELQKEEYESVADRVSRLEHLLNVDAESIRKTGVPMKIIEETESPTSGSIISEEMSAVIHQPSALLRHPSPPYMEELVEKITPLNATDLDVKKRSKLAKERMLEPAEEAIDPSYRPPTKVHKRTPSHDVRKESSPGRKLTQESHFPEPPCGDPICRPPPNVRRRAPSNDTTLYMMEERKTKGRRWPQPPCGDPLCRPPVSVLRRLFSPSQISSKNNEPKAVPTEWDLSRSPSPDQSTKDQAQNIVDDTASSIDSEVQQSKTKVVPKLDLSYLESDLLKPQYVYSRPNVASRFKNVSYEVVTETPSKSSTIRTEQGISDVSSLVMPVPDVQKQMRGSVSPSSISSILSTSSRRRSRDFSRRRCVRFRNYPKVRRRPNIFVRLFRKMFRKTRKPSGSKISVPLYSSSESVSLDSPSTQTPTSYTESTSSPPDVTESTQTSSTSLMGITSGKEIHLRGGESQAFDYHSPKQHRKSKEDHSDSANEIAKKLYVDASDSDITSYKHERQRQLTQHLSEIERTLQERRNTDTKATQVSRPGSGRRTSLAREEKETQTLTANPMSTTRLHRDQEHTRRYSREPPERDTSADMRIGSFASGQKEYEKRPSLKPEYVDSSESSTISSNTAAQILGLTTSELRRRRLLASKEQYHKKSSSGSRRRYSSPGHPEAYYDRNRSDTAVKRSPQASNRTPHDKDSVTSSLSDPLRGREVEQRNISYEEGRSPSRRTSVEQRSNSHEDSRSFPRRPSADQRSNSYEDGRASPRRTPTERRTSPRRASGEPDHEIFSKTSSGTTSYKTDSRLSYQSQDHKRRPSEGDSSYKSDSSKGFHRLERYKGRLVQDRMYDRGECYEGCNCCKCSHYRNYDECATNYSGSSTNMMDLAYQNNEDYEELVHELEDTLSQRNKERVRRTMREFEIMSSQNRNLERPIFDDEEIVETPRLQKPPRAKTSPCRCPKREPAKLTKHERCPERCCPERCPERRPPKHQMSYGYVEGMVRNMDPNGRSSELSARYPKFKKTNSSSKWQMDHRTGEWYKVYDADAVRSSQYKEQGFVSDSRRSEEHAGRCSRGCRCQKCCCVKDDTY